MNIIKNPVLKGFCPDPSICRVGEDYYIAVSTFEWLPGVRIFHSKNLVNWSHVASVLNSEKFITLKGIEDSAGVWAPCLTYNNGLFYLVYSRVKKWRGPYKDVDNFLVTATSVKGPWCEPIYLNSCGFDPSLFHDDNGKKWLLTVNWDYRKITKEGQEPCFCGILIQEYSQIEKKLTGKMYNIFQGTSLGLVEGAHIYQKNGYYYLFTAEGGTFEEHAESVARSRTLLGEYVVMPDNPLITSKNTTGDVVLKRSGHGSLVETQTGQWYFAHLCSRRVSPENASVLGRETAIQKIAWDSQEWPRLSHKTDNPAEYVQAPDFLETAVDYNNDNLNCKTDFSGNELAIWMSSLRVHQNSSWINFNAPGLTLKGGDSLTSPFDVSLVAKRVDSFSFEATTAVEFVPESHFHSAGLILYYNSANYYYLKITKDSIEGTVLGVTESLNDSFKEHSTCYVTVPEKVKLYLKVKSTQRESHFFYSLNGVDYQPICCSFNPLNLSDEIAGGFTGMMVGITCQDMALKEKWANFSFFEYIAKN